MKTKRLKNFFIISLIATSACKEVNVKTHGQSLSEQQINYIEKRLQLLENKVNLLESKLIDTNDSATENKNESESNPLIENVNYTIDESISDDPFIKTNPEIDTDILIVVYTDLLCQTCRTFIQNIFPQIRQWVESHPNSELRLRDFPLASDQKSRAKTAAIASNCINEKSDYWKFISMLSPTSSENEDFIDLAGNFPETDYESFKNCLLSNKYDAEIAKDKESGKNIGVKGVPSIFVGKKAGNNSYKGMLIRGSQPADTLISIFNSF